jgi:LPXTG-motif cell wall-anchored protein
VTEDRTPDDSVARTGKKTAGAFDIRNIIGALLGIYGVALLLAGIFGDIESEKTGDVNANLWTGLGLAILSAGLLIWARVRPIAVPEHVEPAGDDPTRPAPRRTPRGH